MGSKKVDWVSASDTGRASYCPHHLELKHKGSKPSTSAKSAMIKGDEAHNKLNRIANDKRCFIATHLYGEDHRDTILLRKFRDKHLMNCWYGQLSIKLYYALSPTLVCLARRINLIDQALKITVDNITIYIKRN